MGTFVVSRGGKWHSIFPFWLLLFIQWINPGVPSPTEYFACLAIIGNSTFCKVIILYPQIIRLVKSISYVEDKVGAESLQTSGEGSLLVIASPSVNAPHEKGADRLHISANCSQKEPIS